MSNYMKGQAEYQERTYKKTRKKELCNLLDEVAIALYQSGRFHELQGRVEDEIDRRRCKRKP